jgi:hypothetical protein
MTDYDIIKEGVVLRFSTALHNETRLWNSVIKHIRVSFMQIF